MLLLLGLHIAAPEPEAVRDNIFLDMLDEVTGVDCASFLVFWGVRIICWANARSLGLISSSQSMTKKGFAVKHAEAGETGVELKAVAADGRRLEEDAEVTIATDVGDPMLRRSSTSSFSTSLSMMFWWRTVVTMSWWSTSLLVLLLALAALLQEDVTTTTEVGLSVGSFSSSVMVLVVVFMVMMDSILLQYR